MQVIRQKRWLAAAGGCVLLAAALYIGRFRLEQAAIAWRVDRAGMFTPPPMADESAWRRMVERARFYWDFADFVVARQKRLKRFDPTLKPLVREVVRRQAAGDDMEYSMHIYREIRWRLNFTPDAAGTSAEIAELRRSLAFPAAEQRSAGEQQASDGSWGLGISAWYLRLYYSTDRIETCAPPVRYPLSLLDRVNSPAKLTAQLHAVLLDDLSRTKEFNREQLDETFSALARILFKSKPTACYAFDPGLREALREFVLGWQNPATGCWGQWILDRQGRIWKMDDMAMTFHVVSDLRARVPHLDRIAKRVLQLDGLDFPAGIRFDGHYENHLNWDVVTIFRAAWPDLDAATRERARAEIARMLHWCLTESYQPDGSFKVSELDDTLGDAFEYGVDFLTDTGYFRRKNRFWTDRDFPEAAAVRDRIEARLKQIGLNSPGIRNAYDILQNGE
jgi:hypothetical protein